MPDTYYDGYLVRRRESGGVVTFNALYATRELAARAVAADAEELGGMYDPGDYVIERASFRLCGFAAAPDRPTPKAPPMAKKQEPVRPDDPVVRAECHSDDYNVEVDFDAAPWFEQASDAELKELAACDWGGDYPADGVAEFMSDRDARVGALFSYLDVIRDDPSKQDCNGFECHVEGADARAWLRRHRPRLYGELFPDEE